MIEKGYGKVEVSKRKGIPYSTVCSIWNDREKTKTRTGEYHSENIKKLRKSSHDVLDDELLRWFKQQKAANTNVDGTVLLAQADKIAVMLGHLEFKCSKGWIDRFKKRHNISFAKISKAVEKKVTDDWVRNEWPIIRGQYHDGDIFNGVETGLFFKMAPQSTEKFINETLAGGQLSRERLTVFVCTNLNGSEKKKLVVIGKFLDPRCFKNVNKSFLLLDYRANANSWMTSEMFEEELRKWNDSLIRNKNRRILLLLDICRAHPRLSNFTNIEFVFLPRNVASVLQAMGQGVIQNLKSNYRKSLAMELVHRSQGGCLDSKWVTVLDACRHLHRAWNDITPNIIRNCWNRSGLSTYFEEEKKIPLSVWLSTRNIPAELKCYVEFNEDVLITKYDCSTHENEIRIKEEEEDDDDDEGGDPLPEVTSIQAEFHLSEVIRYYYGKLNSKEKLEQLYELMKHIQSDRL